MKTLNAVILIITFVFAANAQAKLPVIKSNSNIVSIQDGDNFAKDSWNLSPETKPDIYETSVKKGQKKKVTFKTDIDSISFDVEPDKTYNFIIQTGDAMCYTQIKAGLLSFWNEKNFWESSALKTPYQPNLTDEEKIAGLSKFWSEAKYNFINFPLVPDLDWDKTYLEFIPKVLATKTTLDYYKVLQMFCAKLKDGHTNVNFPLNLSDEVYSRLAIKTRLVENRVIIIQIYDEKLKAEGLQIGQEITEIDGVPVKKYAEENILPYVAVSTSQDLEERLYSSSLLRGSAENPVSLTIKPISGEVFKKTLPRLKRLEINKLIVPQKPFEMKMLPNNVALVKINSMDSFENADKIFAENFAQIEKADALILDLRENGGGDSGVGYRILSFLIDKPFKNSKWFTREYHPSFRAWGKTEKTYGEEASEYGLKQIKQARGENVKPFLKPLIVLSSPRTFSAAEDFLVAFKPTKRGLIIGEPSGGSTGQPLPISLPGGGSARICTKHDAFADGTEFVGVGVIPDILAAPKVSDFIDGKDSVLQTALQTLKKN